MVRLCKRRRIAGKPEAVFFKPAGIRKINLEEVVISESEFEAVRLKDQLGFDQNICSEKMEVSQPTFHRILNNARKKIADAIVFGKAIKIEKKY